ncbi:MAG TPA: sigma-70 family RNA polymerase sigma factor [Candidatus Micrarchaeia archaeon]|nr:sigma-70 family RNA polymerase sigma factor [Candidatus Micrarchaeia archaeon]
MDEVPFPTLYAAHRAAVYRYLVAAVGPEGAEDCFQETFLAALRAFPRLVDHRNLRAWILTIAHRKAIDHHRDRRRRGSELASATRAARRADTDGVAAIPEPADEALWARVRALPSRQRTALTLRVVGDLSYAAIAAATGTSAEASRQNVHLALVRLRRETDR